MSVKSQQQRKLKVVPETQGIEVDGKLNPQDHATLVLAHHNREQARLEYELNDFYWNQECERIAMKYKIDAAKQGVNIGTGIIGPKEQTI